ncbi:MarR family winged helix-turn-helix transcriptional regulator [Alteribacter natronophilus]|uniref:MarR family winged helix-turn-helix transcriptional regulator n=1 Tax=Alteribacter natronophilus TaxID=2583810 RepID=UPI00110F1B73|nr:MarR family transcriptional regulator [Alteribacter natronophilus]TMW70130.1 MarR family transcriptional regulator [Alteribacter natronophilus]
MTSRLERMAGHHISLVGHLLKNKYNANLSELGLTSAQASVLYILFHEGEQKQSELQRRMYVKGSTMNGIVESMLKHGLIEKEAGEEDRRTKMIRITEKGRKLEEKFMKKLEELEALLTEGFSDEENQIMVSWMKRMQENLKEEGGEPDGSERTEQTAGNRTDT